MRTRMRAPNSGVHITSKDAALVKGMLARGDRQHDIASWFGVNAGRIAEIATRATFAGVAPADETDLPPVGPYMSGKAANAAMTALAEAKAALAAAEAKIRSS